MAVGGAQDEGLGTARAPSVHHRQHRALGQLEIRRVGVGETQPIRRRFVPVVQRVERDRGALQAMGIQRIPGEHLARRGKDRRRGAPVARRAHVRQA